MSAAPGRATRDLPGQGDGTGDLVPGRDDAVPVVCRADVSRQTTARPAAAGRARPVDRWTTAVGSAVFAAPDGARRGEVLGERLLSAGARPARAAGPTGRRCVVLRREVVLVDLTGAPAEHRVVIRLDGTTYALDLEERTAAARRAALEPWVSAARPTRRSPAPGPDPTEVRAWARRTGLRVATRGRLPAHVVAAYRAAHETAPKEVHENRRGGRPTG